jgi:hypothetical protein
VLKYLLALTFIAVTQISVANAQNFFVLGAPSSIGVDLSPSTVPFLNVLKNSGGWYTENSSGTDTGEEAALYSTFVNGNHYPTSLTTGGPCPSGPCPSHTFTQVAGYVNPSGTLTIPTGTYVALFTGAQSLSNVGTLAVEGSATFTGGSCTSPSTGRCLVTVTSANSQFAVVIATTDPNGIGNYINNVALVYSPDSTPTNVGVNETAFVANSCLTQMIAACMNPAWVAANKPFISYRMMDWGQTPLNLNKNWSDRSLVSWAFWNENNINDTTTGNTNGYPVEAMLAACDSNPNLKVCWINQPCLSTDSYVTSEATLIQSHFATVPSTYRILPEYCNEWWAQNYLSTIQSQQATGGMAAYPNSASLPCPGAPSSTYSYAFAYSIMRATRTDNLMKSTLGTRVIKEITSQIGNGNDRDDFILQWEDTYCGGSGTNFSGTVASNLNAANGDGVATAPYIGNGNIAPMAWTANSDGGLSNFFHELNYGGVLPQSNVTGNCGNGAGKTCDSGGNTAFTLTSGLSLPSTPPNGTCIGMTFNAAIGASATLAVDGGNAYPLADPGGTALGSGGVSLGQDTVFCLTSATSQGSVTSQWYETNFGDSGGWLASAVAQYATDSTIVNGSYGLNLMGYESGQQFYCFPYNGSTTACEGLYFSANRDVRMGQAYGLYYMELLALPGVTTINHYQDYGPFSFFGEYGMLENIVNTSSARYNAATTVH